MADKPILFSGQMIRAIIEGRKTQTRRVLPVVKGLTLDDLKREWCREGAALQVARHQVKEPPYAPGDRLWVREAARFCSQMDAIKPSEMSPHEPRIYDADGHLYEPACMMIEPGKLRPGMFMPRWASRLTLTVTDVRVQRLQDISDKDAISEGCKGYVSADGEDGLSPGEEFRGLWNSLNDRRGYGWDANPWVVALTFTAHRENIDQMPATD